MERYFALLKSFLPQKMLQDALNQQASPEDIEKFVRNWEALSEKL